MRVLHFFDGPDFLQALKILYDWLKPGGRLYLVNETPYLGNWKEFIPVFEQRLAKSEPWPGVITEPTNYEKSRSKSLPPLVHWLDKQTLQKALNQTGFNIKKISYIDRAGQFPDDLLLDGRESVGVVAVKPSY